MKLIFTLTSIFSIIFFSCQKELNEFNMETQPCKIIKAYYYGGSGAIYDSANFIYDAAGKIIKWQGGDGYYDYFYSGNNITAQTFKDNITGDLLYLDSISYDAHDKVSQLVFYDLSQLQVNDTIHEKYLFQYQNSQLSQVVKVEFFNYGYGPFTDTTITSVFWNASGNIEKMITQDVYYNAYDSIYYQYNADPNYFKLIHPHFFLFDPEFDLHAGFEPHLAYFYSRNNVTNFRIYGNWDYPVTYGLDSLHHATQINMGGFDYMKYNYQCW